MDEINRMLATYRRNPESLEAPSIDNDVLRFLDAGLASAEQVDSRRADPLFALGSDVTYKCKNARGERMTLVVWGNTDGWGIMEARP